MPPTWASSLGIEIHCADGPQGDLVFIDLNGKFLAEDYLNDGKVNCLSVLGDRYYAVLHHGMNPLSGGADPITGSGGDIVSVYGFLRDVNAAIREVPPTVLYLPVGQKRLIGIDYISRTEFWVSYPGRFPVSCRLFSWDPGSGEWECSTEVPPEDRDELLNHPNPLGPVPVGGAGGANTWGVIPLRRPKAASRPNRNP
jgi:hypothetical protein